MHRRCWVPITVFATVLVVQANLSGWAQDSDRSERYFDYLDRDRNGELDSEEFRRLDERMRDRFRGQGMSGDRPIAKSQFLDAYRRADDERRREDEARRNGSSSPGSSSSPSSSSGRDRGRSSRSREKVKLTLPLPSQYQTYDLNKDDQIGLYEWDKTKFAEFFALDRNKDGFLTPNELDDPPKAAAAGAVAAVGTAAAGRPTAAPATPAPSAVAGQPGVNAAMSPDKPASTDDPDTRQAKYFFSLTDKDKNGEISAEEWTASRGIRPLFEKASVTPSLPMKEAGFVEQYLAIKKKK